MCDARWAASGPLRLAAQITFVWIAVCGMVRAGKPGTTSTDRTELGKYLAVLLEVGREGKGNAAATEAWEYIAAADAKALPHVLAALDGADPLPANWVAAAAEAMVEECVRSNRPLPVAGLKEFVLDTVHAPRARRLAFEWLKNADAPIALAMTTGFLHDPSPELRREAVSRLIDEAASKKGQPTVSEIYHQALSGACDLDQVKTIKVALEQLGEKVDLARHFGFITHWQVIGPFDNRGELGFDVVYPPEENIDLTAKYEGKPRDAEPRSVDWQPTTTQDEFGVVDLKKAIVQENGVAGYAWAEFWSDRERPAELRLGRDNAGKIWLNDRLIHEHRVYHSGSEMDQYVARGTLQEGRNTILLKVLQNEQKEDWAQGWSFQLRVCDSAGQAILSTKEDGQ
ncbi:MAG TPA: hypothetical protein VHC22_08935 [Pirellulales bacterium]|nr:hypothetical protein [Pirellulales bacterium]